MKTLAIVVPCYNEEETIPPFLEACQAVERQMANQLISTTILSMTVLKIELWMF